MLWTIDQLKNLVTSHESDSVRLWAMERLTRQPVTQEWAAFAAEQLDGDDEHVSARAAGALVRLERPDVSRLDFEVRGSDGLRVAAYAGRTEVFHDAVEAGFFGEIALSDPRWLVDNADHDHLTFKALAVARVSEFADVLAESCVDVFESDEDDIAETVRELLASSLELGRIAMVPDDVDETDGELFDAAQASDWSRFVEICLDRIADLATDADVDDRCLRWNFAMAEALAAADLAVVAGRDEAELIYSLLVELPSFVSAVRTADGATSLEGWLEAYRGGPSLWRRERVEPEIRKAWAELHATSPEEAQTIVEDWVDAELEDPFERSEMLFVAQRLEGFDFAGVAAHWLARYLDDDPEASECEDVLVAHYNQHPEHLREQLPEDVSRMSEEKAVARWFFLSALATTNEEWASDSLREFVHLGADLTGDDDLAIALRRHGDPAMLDHCLALYEECPSSSELLMTLRLLAELGGVSLPDDIVKRIEIVADGRKVFAEQLQAKERVPLMFDCGECGIEFVDVFDDVIFRNPDEPGGDTFLPRRPVTCPFCAAVDTYETRPLVEMVVILNVSDLLERFSPWELPSGAPLDRPTPLLRSIRERIDADPSNLSVWDDLAGFGALFDRPELVEEAQAAAAEIDPDHEVAGLVGGGPLIEPMPADDAAGELSRLQRQTPRRKRKEIGKARKASRFPIAEAWASPWTDPLELVVVLVVRKLPRGRFAVGYGLVDLACMGFQGGFVEHSIERHEVDRLLDLQPDQMFPVDPSLAAKIVDIGVRYALAVGLEPADDYFPFIELLRGVEPDHETSVPFGVGGRPLLMPGPEHDVAQLLERLDSTIGRGAYDVGAPAH